MGITRDFWVTVGSLEIPGIPSSHSRFQESSSHLRFPGFRRLTRDSQNRRLTRDSRNRRLTRVPVRLQSGSVSGLVLVWSGSGPVWFRSSPVLYKTVDSDANHMKFRKFHFRSMTGQAFTTFA